MARRNDTEPEFTSKVRIHPTDKAGYRISRREPLPMLELARAMIRDLRIEDQMDREAIFEAWKEVSGAGEYTLSCQWFNSTLCVGLSSSIARSRLAPRRDELLLKINEALFRNPLYSGRSSDPCPVKHLILR